MRSWADYQNALAHLKSSPADVSDDEIAIFAERNPGLAELATEQRERKRRGAEYQARVAAAETSANYERDVRLRRYMDNANQRSACGRMGEPPASPRRVAGVVRVLSREERQRQRDRALGIVRLSSRERGK